MREYSGDSTKTIDNISEEEFYAINEETEDVRFYYDSKVSSIIINAAPSPIHEATNRFFWEVIRQSKSEMRGISPYSVHMGGSHSFKLYDYTDEESTTKLLKVKVPDFSIEVILDDDDDDDDNYNDDNDDNDESESEYPSLVVEAAYSQSYETALGHIKDWILGSFGAVRCAILVNLEKPANIKEFSDPSKWSGFMEVYHLAA
jgi:hypothetical protein